MRAYELRGAFGFENLTKVERPDRAPGPGEILIKMLAVSINYRDLLMIRGLYNPRQPLPLIPFSDGVGRVVAIGDGVTRTNVGDRVIPTFFQGWYGGEPAAVDLKTSLGGPRDGVLAETMVVSEQDVVTAPPALTDEEASSLPCAGLTAWSALVTYGHVQAGDTVVVQGTGGVSLFALQLARIHGAEVIVTSRTSSKLEMVRALGAKSCIDLGVTPDWPAAVRQLTGGRGADHVVDVGGAQSLAQSIKASRPFGRISLIGMLGGGEAQVNVIPILMANLTLQGILVGSRSGLEALGRAVTLSNLRPVIDRTFSFDELQEALHYLESGQHCGKVCIRVGD